MAPEDKSSKTVMSVSGGVVHQDGGSYDVLYDNFGGLDIGQGVEESMSFVNNSSREDKLDEAVSSPSSPSGAESGAGAGAGAEADAGSGADADAGACAAVANEAVVEVGSQTGSDFLSMSEESDASEDDELGSSSHGISRSLSLIHI